MAPFQTVEKGMLGARGPPRLTVYQDGTSRLTAEADRQLGQPEAVAFAAGTGADAGYLQITPTDPDAEHAYSCSRNDSQAGADLNTTVVMRDWVGVDIEALTEAHAPPIEIDGDTVVADCRDLPGVETGGQDASDDGSVDDDTTVDTEDTEASDEEVKAAMVNKRNAVSETTETAAFDETVAIDEPDTDADEDTPPWRQGGRDRRERVHLYVAAMVNELGTLKSTYADIAEQVGHPDAHGNAIRYDLQAMDGYEATEYEDPEDGPTVWRIAKTDDTEDTDPDEQDAADQDSDPDLLEGVISAEGDDGEVELPADEVVDAIASAEDVHDAQVALGLDRVGVRLLLQELDMHDMLAKGQDGVHQDVVRETVVGYLQERDA